MVGAIDVASKTIETPEEVAATLRNALRFVDADKLYPCTNCGMAPLPGCCERKAECAQRRRGYRPQRTRGLAPDEVMLRGGVIRSGRAASRQQKGDRDGSDGSPLRHRGPVHISQWHLAAWCGCQCCHDEYGRPTLWLYRFGGLQRERYAADAARVHQSFKLVLPGLRKHASFLRQHVDAGSGRHLNTFRRQVADGEAFQLRRLDGRHQWSPSPHDGLSQFRMRTHQCS